MTADTVIPAKAGIQYPDNGMGSTAWSAMLETASRCKPLVCTSQNWVLDCGLRSNDGQRPRCPLFLRVSA